MFKLYRKEVGEPDGLVYAHEDLFEMQWFVRGMIRNIKADGLPVTNISDDHCSFDTIIAGRSLRYVVHY
jgi:hypothetical protein